MSTWRRIVWWLLAGALLGVGLSALPAQSQEPQPATAEGNTITGKFQSPDGNPAYFFGLNFSGPVAANVVDVSCGPGSVFVSGAGPSNNGECGIANGATSFTWIIKGTKDWSAVVRESDPKANFLIVQRFWSEDKSSYQFDQPGQFQVVNLAGAPAGGAAPSSLPNSANAPSAPAPPSSAPAPAPSSGVAPPAPAPTTGGGGSHAGLWWSVIATGVMLLTAGGVLIARSRRGADDEVVEQPTLPRQEVFTPRVDTQLTANGELLSPNDVASAFRGHARSGWLEIGANNYSVRPDGTMLAEVARREAYGWDYFEYVPSIGRWRDETQKWEKEWYGTEDEVPRVVGDPLTPRDKVEDKAERAAETSVEQPGLPPREVFTPQPEKPTYEAQ
jgi:hypothetical protein